MLRIRLLRRGKKNQPVFKIVVVEKKFAPQSGKFVEEVGYLDRINKKFVLKKERIAYWLKVGAKPSEAVKDLLKNEKILN